MADTALLCMAYGSPDGDAGVERYFTHIRGGRPPSPEALEELRARYRAVGGSPLDRITREQTAAIGAAAGLPAFAAMKHSEPFVEDVCREIAGLGFRRLVALPLAPHFARMSVGGYERAIRAAWTGELDFIGGFSEHPAFAAAVAGLLREALAGGRPERLFFTAHSLPRRIVDEGDAYDRRLLDSCEAVARELELPPWEFAFQSASTTGEPWLGPDLLDAIAASGARDVLVCPIGFVADHLEILYDLDLETAAFCAERGIRFRRTASFNASPAFVEAMATVVRSRLA